MASIVDYPNVGYVPDVHTFQAHGSTDAQSARVIDVSVDGYFPGEQSGSAGHHENQDA